MAQKYRYGRNEKVKGGTLKRSKSRLKQSGPIRGVDASDGITGREARKIKRVNNRRPDRTHDGVPKRRLPPEERALRREVRAETRLQFGPQEREIGDRRRQEQEFANRNANYFQQHQQDMALAQQRQIAFQQGLLAAQNQAVQTAATTDQSQNNQLLQQQQQSAAQRGATVDPSVAQTLQQGVAARQATGVAGTNLLAQQGSAQGAYMTNQMQQAGEQGLLSQQDSQARLQKLDQLAADLAADKGAFRAKTRRTIQLEDRAFGLDVAKERFDQAEKLADNRRQARNDRFSRRDRRADNRLSRQRERHMQEDRRHDNALADRREARQQRADLADDGKRNGSNFTPTQVRSGRQKLRNLVGRVKNNVDPPDSVDPLLARAAVQLADHGGVDPKLARKIRRAYGFTPKVRRLTGSRGDSAGP